MNSQPSNKWNQRSVFYTLERGMCGFFITWRFVCVGKSRLTPPAKPEADVRPRRSILYNIYIHIYIYIYVCVCMCVCNISFTCGDVLAHTMQTRPDEHTHTYKKKNHSKQTTTKTKHGKHNTTTEQGQQTNNTIRGLTWDHTTPPLLRPYLIDTILPYP